MTGIETRYGRLTGGPPDGEDAFVAELSHTFGKSIHGAALFSFDRDPGGRRRLGAVGDLRLGVEAFGDLGTTHRFLPLPAAGGAFQARLVLEYEFHF